MPSRIWVESTDRAKQVRILRRRPDLPSTGIHRSASSRTLRGKALFSKTMRRRDIACLRRRTFFFRSDRTGRKIDPIIEEAGALFLAEIISDLTESPAVFPKRFSWSGSIRPASDDFLFA